MERAFPLYEKWGIAGVKVDFMQRDDQEMVNFYERLVKLAARHRLMVDYHGAYKPTGMERTYPNLITREGVMGNEHNKWSARVTPTHNTTLPFTRMLCGPMDVTPVGFRHKTPKTFRIVGEDAPGPFVMTTRAHQLAMMVVYFSPLQVMADSPYNYRISPGGLDFLKAVPTTWDETRVIDGFPGEFVVDRAQVRQRLVHRRHERRRRAIRIHSPGLPRRGRIQRALVVGRRRGGGLPRAGVGKTGLRQGGGCAHRPHGLRRRLCGAPERRQEVGYSLCLPFRAGISCSPPPRRFCAPLRAAETSCSSPQTT